MKKKTDNQPSTRQTKKKLKDASTQTDRYVDYMPLPIILDIKSEDEYSDDNYSQEAFVGTCESVKVEIEERTSDDENQRPAENPPLEQYYFEEKFICNEEQMSSANSKEKKQRKRKQTEHRQPKSKKPKTDKTQKQPRRRPAQSLKPKDIECSLCKFTCRQPSHLKRHMLMHTGEKPHRCEHCPKQFAQKTDLNRHMSLHASQYDFHCNSCGRGFPNQHLTSEHETTCRTKRYACDQCDHVTFSIGNLHLHKRTHTGERPFACNSCDKRFTRVSHLNQHVKLHAEDFELHCGMCGRGYADANELQQHQNKCKNRKFQCHMCKDVHHRMDNLKRHIKITHMGEKEILCEYCSMQFPAKSSLVKHIRHRHRDRVV